MRRGLGINRGKGYYNIVPLDSHIHSLSAKGVKTHQQLKDREVIKQACGYVFKDDKCPRCGAMYNQLHSHYLMCPKCEEKKEKEIGLAKMSGDFWAKRELNLTELEKKRVKLENLLKQDPENKRLQKKLQDVYWKIEERYLSAKGLNAKFTKNAGIINAEKVSSLLKKKLKGYNKGEFFIDTYHNGRENGYSLLWLPKYYMKKPYDMSKERYFLVAENRNSDNIVVYEDKKYSPYGGISEEAFANKTYFNPKDYNSASTFIAKRIKQIMSGKNNLNARGIDMDRPFVIKVPIKKKTYEDENWLVVYAYQTKSQGFKTKEQAKKFQKQMVKEYYKER